jgi:hypothetical protein
VGQEAALNDVQAAIKLRGDAGVVFYHRGMGEAAVRSDIFPLVDGGLIGGRLWSEVEQRRAILRNLFGVPPT